MMLSEKVDSKYHRTDVLCYFPPRERRKNAGRARTATQSKHVRGGANAAGQFLGGPRPILRVAPAVWDWACRFEETIALQLIHGARWTSQSDTRSRAMPPAM